MRLYSYPLSGHSHRARLFLSLIGMRAEIVDLDLNARDQRSEPFPALNPLGQVPVLVNGETIVADSNAILVYLANFPGRVDWLPEDSIRAALVQRWLSVAAGPLAAGPAAARLITLFGASLPAAETIAKAHAILRVIDQALVGRAFLLGADPTIADVAIYSYSALAPEGNVSPAALAEPDRGLAGVCRAAKIARRHRCGLMTGRHVTFSRSRRGAAPQSQQGDVWAHLGRQP